MKTILQKVNVIALSNKVLSEEPKGSRLIQGYSVKSLVIALFFSLSAFSQNVWTQKTAPTNSFTARNACAGFSIGNKGYFGTGGAAAGETADWHEYDQATDTWTKKADFPGGVREAMVCFSIGTKGYVGLGDIGGSSAFADFWEYNPATNTWTQKANFPGGARTTAVGFSIGNKGYVGCGDDFTALKKDFWEYNPATDIWTQKANFGGTARSDANGFSIGTKGYIGIGDDGTVPLKKDFWEYDPSTDIWTAKANFGGGARTTATGFSINGLGYLGAGDNGSQLKKDFWEWNPATNVWTLTTAFTGASRSDMLGFAIGNKAYAGNGNTCGASCYINDWYEFSNLTASLETIEQQIKYSVSPNPAENMITIQYEVFNNENFHLIILDVLGKNVLDYELLRVNNTEIINVSNLNNGIYYYQIAGKNTAIKGGKLIIAK